MAYELEGRCDDCNAKMDIDDNVYCFSCVHELRVQIENLENRVRDLEAQLAEVE